jgi:hypothetical protein
MQNEPVFDGAIPGENFTSDTRNYPWHRPPDLVDYDEIVEDLLLKVSSRDVLPGMMSSLSMGTSVAFLTDYMILFYIGEGRFSIDMGLLAAGPLARYIQIMADEFNVDYDMGLDEEGLALAPDLVKAMRKLENSPEIEAPVVLEPVEQEGFMAPTDAVAPDEEQEAMLGLVDEVEEENNGE